MELHFRSLGSGPALILLHGLLGSLDNWLPLGRQFAEHFTVLAVDQRNHGLSPHSNEFGYDLMAHDLHQFMHAQGLTTAHLLGHSMGGKTAMQFALLYPDQVEKLVVVDMAPRAYAPVHTEALAALQALDLETHQRREDFDEALATQVPDAELRQFLLKNLRRDMAGAFHWKVNLPAIWENYLHLNAALSVEGKFSKPSLFLRGGKSDYVQDTDLELIRQFFPEAELRTIPEAGHWVHADEPEAFLGCVMSFLAADERKETTPAKLL
jgi:pimeloyl-ACP methyl ester carboxylesterase